MANGGAAQLSKKDQLFGRLALKNKLITEEQYKECAALIGADDSGMDLGGILQDKGYVSEKHVKLIRSKVDERAAAAGETKGEGGAPKEDSSSPISAKDPEGAVTPQDLASVDFSDLQGKPIGAYLERLREFGVSDFHFQCAAVPFVRIHGSIVKLKHPVLTPEVTEAAIRQMLSVAQWDHLEEKSDFDFCYEKEDHGRYRANCYRERRGYNAIFRMIPNSVPTLSELGMPETLSKFTTYRQGIVLITGPSGCGKSSTMAALVELVNKERYDNVITVEDPIEFVFESKNCNVVQRHAGVHTESFGSALRSALREDPDVIMVGEMRDLETISMAITAAETGHLVLGTLHTTNAIRSIDRVIDVFPPKEQEQIRAMVSESIRGVISQQLIPRASGKGQVPALEVMFTTPAVANMIRESKTFQLPSVLQTGKKQGMCTMDDSIKALLNRKIITREAAIFHSENPEMFKKAE